MKTRRTVARDPIVEEIHQIRGKMLAECGGDFGELFDRLMAAQPRPSESGVRCWVFGVDRRRGC